MPATTRTRRGVRRTAAVVLALGAVALSGCRYHVALYGDIPAENNVTAYERLIGAVNRDAVAFTIHVGDFKAGATACSDTNLRRNIDWFDRFSRPHLYTPGDNDWTDCTDPLTRLRRLRELMYRGDGARSRGQETMAVTSQATTSKPENARWAYGPITFATIHVVGGSNGSGAERDDRRDAAVRWIRAAFAQAKEQDHRAVVIVGHAGLRFSDPEGGKGPYEAIFKELRAQTVAFGRPVLYVHGDGHVFIDDRPMRTSGGATVQNFRRVQVYGSPDVRWVRLVVDLDGPEPLLTIERPPAP